MIRYTCSVRTRQDLAPATYDQYQVDGLYAAARRYARAVAATLGHPTFIPVHVVRTDSLRQSADRFDLVTIRESRYPRVVTAEAFAHLDPAKATEQTEPGGLLE